MPALQPLKAQLLLAQHYHLQKLTFNLLQNSHPYTNMKIWHICELLILNNVCVSNTILYSKVKQLTKYEVCIFKH